MNILLIPDKFKGSLSASEVIRAIKKGLHQWDPTIKTFDIPASDGGDGFLKTIAHYLRPSQIRCETVNPLGKPIAANYLYDKTKKTAYIELAKASGLALLSPSERSASNTSTYGTGLQIKHALQQGAKHIYIGLGGSATNDAGTGIAAALGCLFYTQEGVLNIPSGKDLEHVIDIDHQALQSLKNISFYAINDVQNPLFGNNGASYTYGKQKGATETDLIQLDRGLKHLSKLVSQKLDKDIAKLPGSGAAGGAAYGLKAFLNADYKEGVDFILALTPFFELINHQNITCIITGEGKIDTQTRNGKLIKGISRIATQHHIPVLAICGRLDLDKAEIKALGLTDAIEIRDPNLPESYSFENAAALISQKSPQLLKKIL